MVSTMNENEILKLLHLTDLHLYANPEEEIYGVRTDVSFRAVLEKALSDDNWRPDAVLLTGDLVEDCSRAGYERLRALLEPLSLPILCLPGNHDDPSVIGQVLNDGDFTFCGHRDFDHWRLILLDSHVGGADFGLLRDDELQRLEQTLQEAGRRNVLVAVHHQPIPIESPWLDAAGLHNGSDLVSLVEHSDQAKLVVWGHVHQAFDTRRGSLRMLSTPSTCAQFTPQTDKCIMDVRPPAFRRLNLAADGNVDTEVCWLDEWIVEEVPPDSRVLGFSADS
jgi:Icc protein